MKTPTMTITSETPTGIADAKRTLADSNADSASKRDAALTLLVWGVHEDDYNNHIALVAYCKALASK